jgi:hypothetical protein
MGRHIQINKRAGSRAHEYVSPINEDEIRDYIKDYSTEIFDDKVLLEIRRLCLTLLENDLNKPLEEDVILGAKIFLDDAIEYYTKQKEIFKVKDYNANFLEYSNAMDEMIVNGADSRDNTNVAFRLTKDLNCLLGNLILYRAILRNF